MATITGLTAAEVEERKQAGQVNSKTERVTKSYPQIIIDNLCTGFNLLLLILGVALIVTNREPIVIGSFSILQGVAYALAVTGIILLNVIISTVQECKAKRRLDKIALLLTPKVTVLRDGVTSVISQEEIVKDDIIVLSAGDQALVDGELLQESYLEMDESLLTGESHTVRKKVGDTIYSGSYAVVGDGLYRVDAFAQDSFASKIVASAQKQVKKKTPLQMETTTIMVMLMALAILYSLVAAAVFLISGKGIGVVVETVAIILEIVPIALFLLIVISYMIAAIRMADSGVLLQDSSAVESISHVDTVCMDKTGTITTNKLRFHDAVYLDDSDVESAISAYIGSIGGKNRTIESGTEMRPSMETASSCSRLMFSISFNDFITLAFV
ncbi:MAG: HAD-IC family P-type ATPase [Candidatus Methanomethylophilaceae archaeon]|nr:HAD-IC family P-type ATPase [Candidatus Methanomethylophilaceae archaeon]